MPSRIDMVVLSTSETWFECISSTEKKVAKVPACGRSEKAARLPTYLLLGVKPKYWICAVSLLKATLGVHCAKPIDSGWIERECFLEHVWKCCQKYLKWRKRSWKQFFPAARNQIVFGLFPSFILNLESLWMSLPYLEQSELHELEAEAKELVLCSFGIYSTLDYTTIKVYLFAKITKINSIWTCFRFC